MRMHYGFPSGNYNVILSKEDLKKLNETGILQVMPLKTPCTTSRLVWNPETNSMDVLDRKEIANFLTVHIDGPVADMEPGNHYVQFLDIIVEKGDK